MAKTQYSFSDDAKKLGAPEDFVVTINQLKVSAGYRLHRCFDWCNHDHARTTHKVPADVDKDGNISGLFLINTKRNDTTLHKINCFKFHQWSGKDKATLSFPAN